MDGLIERWTNGWMKQVDVFCHCFESGQADIGRREVIKGAHCSWPHSFLTLTFIGFPFTCLSQTFTQAVGLDNIVIVTHWNKTSATLSNLTLPHAKVMRHRIMYDLVQDLEVSLLSQILSLYICVY